MSPRVSVIVPVRNGERYLGEALESVLGGTMAPDEVVVVDDGSRDGSADLAAALGDPVRVVRREPSGIAATVNAGIEASKGEVVGFVDADDLWAEDKLERQLERLGRDHGPDAVFGHAREFVSPDLSAGERERIVVRGGDHPARVRGTMLARRSLLDRVGPLDETLTVGEFVDWHARGDALGMRTEMGEEVVLHRRLHAANQGRVATAARLDYVRVARAALARRRAAEG